MVLVHVSGDRRYGDHGIRTPEDNEEAKQSLLRGRCCFRLTNHMRPECSVAHTAVPWVEFGWFFYFDVGAHLPLDEDGGALDTAALSK